MKSLFLALLVLAATGVYALSRTSDSFFQAEQPNILEAPSSQKEYPPHPDTIPLMAQKEFRGSDLKLRKALEENDAYVRYSVTYQSEGLTISGILNIPTGSPPPEGFPVLILNHGYIDPHRYTTGAGLRREQDFFARHGYAVFHSDYRNHAQSDFDPANEVRPRTGYVEDVLNAVSALKKSELKKLDTEHIGMLGHSLGGGVTLNIMVTKPETAKAYVLLAPIHADYRVNFEKWVIPEWPETAEQFYRIYWTSEENPQFWHDISAVNFLEKVSAPVLLHQGTTDREVPVEWSRHLAERLGREGKDITYYEYPDEPHVFGSSQTLVMQRTLTFFDKTLKP